MSHSDPLRAPCLVLRRTLHPSCQRSIVMRIKIFGCIATGFLDGLRRTSQYRAIVRHCLQGRNTKSF
ncbi:hypothetical protein RSW31_26250, partial [Escherichia coli]